MYKFNLLTLNKLGNFEQITDKIFYNTDDKKSLNEWIKENSTINQEKFESPNLKSSLSINQKGGRKVSKNFLGWFSCGTNTVQRNNIDVIFFSSPYGHHGTSGYETTNENFKSICAGFSARTLIKVTWDNEKDVYLKPNTLHENFENFLNDSIISTIFNNNSQQSSLRQITYKDKLWDIKNEFFWMSKEEILNLANENNFTNLYNDARTDSDRHVYKLLFGEERIYDKLSPDAKLVLDKATELVKKSMSMREVFANDENHLKSWDAGYAQLKLLWKEYYAEDFKEFRQLYKNLEDRMRPLVYELGFLMK